jgi:ketosteroid isomerase-like protein
MAKKKKDKKKDKKSKKDKGAGLKAIETKPNGKQAAGKKGKAKKASKASKKDPIRALAKKIVELTTANDDEATLALYAESAESAEMGMPPMTGLDAIRAKFKGWHEMASDPQFTAKNVWVDGNTIIIEWVGDVTLKSSGKRAQLREIAVHEIDGGKIRRERYYYDPAALQP